MRPGRRCASVQAKGDSGQIGSAQVWIRDNFCCVWIRSRFEHDALDLPTAALLSATPIRSRHGAESVVNHEGRR